MGGMREGLIVWALEGRGGVWSLVVCLPDFWGRRDGEGMGGGRGERSGDG